MSPPTRRAEYAEATRQAILGAARQLFEEKGYFATRVEDIARAARVAPATVYAVGRGKSGLIGELIRSAVRSTANVEIKARIERFDNAYELISFMVDTTAGKFAAWSPLMRQVQAAAAQEPAVEDALEIAYASLANGLARTADRLAELGALRGDVTAADASAILWYYLNNGSYFTLTDDLRWPLDRAVMWLKDQLEKALIRPLT